MENRPPFICARTHSAKSEMNTGEHRGVSQREMMMTISVNEESDIIEQGRGEREKEKAIEGERLDRPLTILLGF